MSAIGRAIGLAVVVVPASAGAANTNKARVPAAFWQDACIVAVDRTEDPVATLGLAIPYEDVALTEDELPDSRRFQFFALCRDHPVQQPLPNWVMSSDAERALQVGIVDALPDAQDVLQTQDAWQIPGHDGAQGSCVVAINAADDRVPISCEATRDGVAWDTTGVAAGTYVVRGYTFEPDKNLWSRRPGVVRIVDGDIDPGPAVTLNAPRRKVTAYEQPGYVASGCIAALAGTTVAVQWALAADAAVADDAVWHDVATVEPDGETFEVWFVPPAETIYKAVYLRAVATDPMGRTWIAHADHEIVVLPDCGVAEGDEPGGVADACGAVPDGWVPPGPIATQPAECDAEPTTDDGDGSGSAGDETAADGGSSGSGDPGAAGEPGGCACAAASPGPTAAWAWPLVIVVARRGRGARVRTCAGAATLRRG